MIRIVIIDRGVRMIKLTNRRLNNLADRILENRISKKDKDMVNYLFFSYNEFIPNNLNYIIVFAGSGLWRIKTAIRVYKRKKCKIILSGGNISKNKQKECYRYFDYAVKRGVPEKDLICEAASTNTALNALNTLKLIARTGNPEPRILIISSVQHLYRVSRTVLMASKKLYYFPKCFYYPSYPRNYRPDRWFLFQYVREDIASELKKIVKYHLLEVEEKLM